MISHKFYSLKIILSSFKTFVVFIFSNSRNTPTYTSIWSSPALQGKDSLQDHIHKHQTCTILQDYFLNILFIIDLLTDRFINALIHERNHKSLS